MKLTCAILLVLITIPLPKAAPVIPDDDGDDFKAQKVKRKRDKRMQFIGHYDIIVAAE